MCSFREFDISSDFCRKHEVTNTDSIQLLSAPSSFGRSSGNLLAWQAPVNFLQSVRGEHAIFHLCFSPLVSASSKISPFALEKKKKKKTGARYAGCWRETQGRQPQRSNMHLHTPSSRSSFFLFCDYKSPPKKRRSKDVTYSFCHHSTANGTKFTLK